MNTQKSKILEGVKKNNITMIPKWKFVLYSTLGIVGIIFIFFVMVFLLSLILFVLSRYGFMYMPFFGVIATLRALSAIPVALLLCTVLLLIIIETLSRFYSFSFRRPLAVTLLILTAFAIGVSFIISETSMHDYVRGYASDHHFDMMTRMYDRPLPFKPSGDVDILRGEVISTTPTTTTLRLFDGTTAIVYASTTGVRSWTTLVGEDVTVFGEFVDNHFQVENIRPTPHTPFGGHIRTRNTSMMKQGVSGGMMMNYILVK